MDELQMTNGNAYLLHIFWLKIIVLAVQLIQHSWDTRCWQLAPVQCLEQPVEHHRQQWCQEHQLEESVLPLERWVQSGRWQTVPCTAEWPGRGSAAIGRLQERERKMEGFICNPYVWSNPCADLRFIAIVRWVYSNCWRSIPNHGAFITLLRIRLFVFRFN